MKSRDLASLAFKIIGIIVLIQSMNFIYMMLLNDVVFSMGFSLILIVFGLNLALGIILILTSKKIAKLVCREDNDINISCSAKELQAIAFSCIGLWLICSSLYSMSINVFYYFKYFQSFAEVNVRYLIQNICRLIIGIVLFFQSRGLVTIWEKLNKSRNPVHKD